MTSQSRSAAYLAALASSAVPGLDPAAARAVKSAVSADFDVAFVTDTQQRQWVVRAPRTPMAGARMDSSVALLALLARRVPFHVPVPKGFTEIPEGRAAVYPYLPGRPLRLSGLPAGPGLAAALGQALAALHNVDRRLYDEAGMPSYEAQGYRDRHLADVDRAAATGHVPASLLARWEQALDEVTLWRFAPTPVHGDLAGDQLLAAFDTDDDATTGHVVGVTGWEDAKVADPADDFAALVDEAPTAAVESVFEAYVAGRTESPDPHLQRRARLAGELRLVRRLLAASTAGSSELVRAYAGQLRRLDERVDPHDLDPPAPVVVAPKPVLVPASPAAAPAGGSPGAPEPIGAADTAGAAHPTWPAGPAGPAGASEPAERHTTPVTRARTIEDEALGHTQPLAPGDLVDELPENSTVTEELPLHRGGPHDRRGAPG